MAKQGKIKSLSSGRAGIVKRDRPLRLSAKTGRTIIRSHHRLNKSLTEAERAGDTALVERLQQQIDDNGGIETYQQASLQGQSNERGGDSSRVLVDWLKARMDGEARHDKSQDRLRVLEVGALAASNACSRWRAMHVTRIDLNAQSADIQQQDFMERPLPGSAADKFDVISLSLVLNYVPSREGRGEMLKRTRQFLDAGREGLAFAPSLFVVLPAPCLQNSRYLDEELFDEMMQSLGYRRLERKVSAKLVYYLFRHEAIGTAEGVKGRAAFSKREVNPGGSRNNFSIVL